jgi:hypothetical protein
MAGDAIEHATRALLEELVGFSPSPRDRANLQRVLETTWRVMDKARDLIEAQLNSNELERTIEQALRDCERLIWQCAGILGLDPGALHPR